MQEEKSKDELGREVAEQLGIAYEEYEEHLTNEILKYIYSHDLHRNEKIPE